ncbi:unnamed protein product [Dibothriocephalus latus]|uniref:UBC core domain-containing protein n=1 Tax=Dibothriocephalus latus TaxID=60516 RepID=A0A3P7NY84_DIBLA|nr:unnamed protein product [Dibothriocephalus latus]
MACKGGRSYLKDLRSLYINIEESTNKQASISSVCGGKLEILLTPNDGPYAHAIFTLEIVASDNYPRVRPEIRFLTPIFHPNINTDGGYICLSLMDDWNSCYSFLDVIKAVLFLLANPNFDSANNSFGSLSPEYRDRFEEVCRQFLAGFPIKGEVYPANEKWCEWARANNCFPIPPSDGPTASLERQLEAKVEAQLSDPDLASDRMSSSTPSTYVPSVANVRYSVGTDSDQFGSVYSVSGHKYLQTFRILLYQQENRGPQIFYFSDYLGCPSCQQSKEPVYFCNQTDLETPGTPNYHESTSQSSTFLDWLSYRRVFYSGEPYSWYSSSPSVSQIATLFREKEVVTNAYELFPDCGYYVLCALFAEPRSKPKQMEDDPLDGSVTLEDFFDLRCEIDCARPIDGHQPVVASNESFSPCYDCRWYYNQTVSAMQELTPSEWIFLQTRWPPVLAPRQVIDLELNCPARIPCWRGSTPRLVKDVAIFCRQHLKLDFLLLLDPLALSPWSPVLNALCPLTVDPSSPSPHHPSAATTCKERWTSLFWLTAADTSRSSLTWPQHIIGSQGSRWEHTVARLALLSNWLAWFSRVEIAVVLGQSRQSGRIVCEGVATACLHPASLGCGQAPLLDLWPLWLVRLMLRSSCGLFARLCTPADTTTRCYFPLSDTDEI